ncbi:maleate cis-trans isomerase family protein [Thalassococcus lentus]|uniref:Aspartate/glutamate racemase family protein n=1 Tax=Thalassococcus lentus TaxID=1210524 RepID=A0ABT4XXH5_9RHOB|nr:aspartate/glutamate racemase family protein [Thalassococcus lentus]MDA7426670.1 aspartate/glutamate racemase family protein [Thalassococcus lentus]
MTAPFPYVLGPALGERANLGLIVLQSDETLEHDCRRLFPLDGVAQYVSRVQSAPEVSRETLAEMEADLPRAAGLLPPPVNFDVVGYGCTSGTSVIGAWRVETLVKTGCSTRAVTNPLSALVAACQALGVQRLALLSPYVESVSHGLRAAVAEHGIETPVFGSFDEEVETRVARIDGPSVHQAAQQLGEQADVDAVFLSCTNLRTLDVIAPLEQALGKPVLSSNQVLAWHMMRLAGLQDSPAGMGQLWKV